MSDNVAVDLDRVTRNIGELLGVINLHGLIIGSWFGNPGVQLRGLPERVSQLLTLIDDALGPAESDAPEAFPDVLWYSIPNPSDGSRTGFYVVAPERNDDISTAALGIGVYRSLDLGGVTFDAYALVPLIEVSTSAEPTFALASQPVRLGVEAKANDGFTAANGVTFSGVTLELDIYLGQDLPGGSLTFVDFKTNGVAEAPIKTYTTLESVVEDIADIAEWVSSVLLRGAFWLDQEVGSSGITIGEILAAACVLKNAADGASAMASATTHVSDATYTLNTDYLKANVTHPIALVENFLFNLLKLLADCNEKLISIPGGSPDSGIFIVAEPNIGSDSVDYGVRLLIEDIVVGPSEVRSGGAASDGALPSPEITVQLGKWIGAETDETSWVRRSLVTDNTGPAPGISIFLLSSPTTETTCTGDGPDVTFNPRVELVSVGFDVARADGQPLVNVDGYILESAELRLYVAKSNADTFDVGFGAAVLGLGVPLGPSFGQAVQGSSDHVARSLLESGAPTDGANPAKGEPAPVNPSFGFSAARVFERGSFVAQLYDRDNNPADTVVLPIQRALGPLQCEKLGVGWPANATRVSLLFDGGVALGALAIDLVGLSIGIPIATPADFSTYELDLDGLGVSFNAGAVSLSAAFVKVPPDATAIPPRSYTEYDGEAVVVAGPFSIAALGSYAYVPVAQPPNTGYASLFIFGVFDGTLGGPPPFVVTGLALGFGYNRALILPGLDDVATFPLVKGLSDPSYFGGANGSKPAPAAALEKLVDVSPPERGEYWLAAGVRFTSFDLIQSSALLTVEFGNELEIAILGVSWASMPPPTSPGVESPSVTFAYIEVGIEVKVLPDQGEVIASGILTPASYVLDAACKLTGGFAFAVWFGRNPHAGQFVLTAGGYHPDFPVPSYFPVVPRLGFNWPLPGGVSIRGESYFALTPSALMTGGRLEVLYDGGFVKAWFKAWLDAVIEWAPFHFEVAIGIDLGASLRVDILCIHKTLTLEVGADLTMWGPELGGIVHVHLYIVTITIGFGASAVGVLAPLSWKNGDGTGFSQTLLPHTASTSSVVEAPVLPLAVAVGQDTDGPDPAGITDGGPTAHGVLTIEISAGLIGTTETSGGLVWIVRPNHFVFSTMTTIPATSITVTNTTSRSSPTTSEATAVVLRPMKATLSSSVLTVDLFGGAPSDAGPTEDFDTKFHYEPAIRSVPAAKFGPVLKPQADGTKQPPEYNALVPKQLLGLENIAPKPAELTPSGDNLLFTDIETAFAYHPLLPPGCLPLVSAAPAAGAQPQQSASATETIRTTLMSETVVDTRAELFAVLRTAGVNVTTNGTLTEFATAPAAVLAGQPLLLGAST